ncbi:MAG: SGNH/GDSL hydrolase family protein, partial [Pseudomonadota bacterium]
MTLRIPKRWLGPHWLRDVFYAIAYLSIFLRQRILPSRQPAILILADSISRGRLPWLRQVFAGQYHVCGPFENGQSTAFSLRRIGLWLSMRRRWVMVVCNWGLHDIRRNGGGPVAVPVEAYAANLRHLITRICRRSDHCLFVTTTPVPPEAPLWHPADVERYNAAARAVMAELGVP